MPPTPQDQAINNVWGMSNLGKQVFLTLPSGQTCHARVIGLQGVLETGVMGEADSLSAFVGREYIRKVRGAKGRPDSEQIDAQKLMKSPEMLQKIVKMVDAITPHVVTEPRVFCHFEPFVGDDGVETTRMIPAGDRVPGGIYTDQVPIEDKMFLFNFALSAVKDAETFREESNTAVGDMADVAVVPGSPERPAGAKRKRPKRRR